MADIVRLDASCGIVRSLSRRVNFILTFTISSGIIFKVKNISIIIMSDAFYCALLLL